VGPEFLQLVTEDLWKKTVLSKFECRFRMDWKWLAQRYSIFFLSVIKLASEYFAISVQRTTKTKKYESFFLMPSPIMALSHFVIVVSFYLLCVFVCMYVFSIYSMLIFSVQPLATTCNRCILYSS